MNHQLIDTCFNPTGLTPEKPMIAHAHGKDARSANASRLERVDEYCTG